jgi:hypothetical protein
MKRVLLIVIVASLLSSGIVARAAEESGPDRRIIEPFPEKVAPKEKDVFEVIGDYLGDRFRDLADIVTLKLGWGNYRSIGVQVRLCYPLQLGAGIFEGWVFAIDRGCIGTMKEARIEGGVSIFYPSYVARKVVWQTDEAKKRNLFFGDVGEEKELTFDDLKMYDDENQHPLTSTLQVQAPCLPRLELSVHWSEVFDFPLSLFNIDGFRVPAPFHMKDGPGGEGAERIPAPSVFWHGQEEKYESYD